MMAHDERVSLQTLEATPRLWDAAMSSADFKNFAMPTSSQTKCSTIGADLTRADPVNFQDPQSHSKIAETRPRRM
jgi:hypothetical protein